MTTPFPRAPIRSATGTSFEAFQAVQQSEERFRLAARAGKMCAYEWDAATNMGVLSGECVALLGIEEGTQITREQFLSKVHPDDRNRLTFAQAGLTPENPNLQISYRIVHPDRGVVWVESNRIAFFDDAGRMLRTIGMLSDITARKLAETELATANDRLYLSLKSGNSVAWDWDVRSGRDCWFGDLQTMFGIPSSTYIGHVTDFRRRVHPEDRELIWKSVQNAMENGKPYVAKFRIL